MTKKRIAILIFTVIVFIAMMLILFGAFIKMNGEETLTVEACVPFEDPGAECVFKWVKIEVRGEVDVNKLGSYELSYRSNLGTKVRTVIVVDTTEPTIELLGSEKVSVFQGTEYAEPGFVANDSYDGDLSASVEITSDLDINTPGEYHISYLVKDSSGNPARVRRTVTVTDSALNPTDFINFNLYEYYSDVICREVPYDEQKYEELIIFGDSFIGRMSIAGVGIQDNLWHRGGITTNSVYYTGVKIGAWDGSEEATETFFDLMDKYKPKTVLIHIGNQCVNAWSTAYFKESCGKFVKDCHDKYPDTLFILCALPPWSKPEDDWYISSKGFSRYGRVNEYNIALCELAREYGMKFMNTAEGLKKPDTGYISRSLLDTDYFHLNKAGFEIMIDYIKKHLDW